MGTPRQPRMFPGFQVLPIYRNLYRFHKLVKGTIIEDNACTTQETWRSQAGAYIEPPPLYYRVFGTESSLNCQIRNIFFAQPS